MTHEILDADGLADDLVARLRRLEARTAHVFGQALPLAAQVYATSAAYATSLRGQQGPQRAVEAALVLKEELIDPAELATSVFWASVLGRAIGYWTGGHERWDDAGKCLGVPAVEAAAILKMSRQGVADAVTRKRLVSCGTGLGVFAMSVADHMHARYPLEGANRDNHAA